MNETGQYNSIYYTDEEKADKELRPITVTKDALTVKRPSGVLYALFGWFVYLRVWVLKTSRDIRHAFRRFPLFAWFTTYFRSVDRFRESGIYRAFHRECMMLAPDRQKDQSRRRAQVSEHSVMLRLTRSFLSLMLSCRARVFGAFFLAFGGVTYGFYLLQNFVPLKVIPEQNQIVGIVLAGFSILLLANKRSIAQTITARSYLRVICFDFLGFRRTPIRDAAEVAPSGSYLLAVLFGLVCGGLTYFVRPLPILAVAGIGLFMLISLDRPEIGLYAMIAAAPFASTLPLVILTAWTVFVFLGKAVVGKRQITVEPLDVLFFAFALTVLASGITSVSLTASLAKAGTTFVLMMGYFLARNMIVGDDTLHTAARVLFLTVTAVCAFALIGYFTGDAHAGWQDMLLFRDPTGRLGGAFDDPNVFAGYILLVIPVLIAVWRCNATGKGKGPKRASCVMISAVLFLLLLFCLVFTYSRGAWAAILFGLIMFCLMYVERGPLVIFAVALAGTVAYLLGAWKFLPEDVITRFLSIFNLTDESMAYRVSVWKSCFAAFLDHPIFGIGIGSYEKVYPLYAISGSESAAHANSVPLQIALESGSVGLFFFFSFVVTFFRRQFSRMSEGQGRIHRTLSGFALLSVTTFLLNGLTDYLFFDSGVMLTFWLLIGAAVAIAKPQQADGKEKPDDSFAIDVPIIPWQDILVKRNARHFYGRHNEKHDAKEEDTLPADIAGIDDEDPDRETVIINMPLWDDSDLRSPTKFVSFDESSEVVLAEKADPDQIPIETADEMKPEEKPETEENGDA